MSSTISLQSQSTSSSSTTQEESINLTSVTTEVVIIRSTHNDTNENDNIDKFERVIILTCTSIGLILVVLSCLFLALNGSVENERSECNRGGGRDECVCNCYRNNPRKQYCCTRRKRERCVPRIYLDPALGKTAPSVNELELRSVVNENYTGVSE